MNCNSCTAQFDHSTHVPRLLIFCGHSLCQLCCQQLHTNSRIQCPECKSNTFIEEVNFLPKNLALLKVNPLVDALSFCPKHEKKYEAFCKKQKMLICVDCILHDSHRNHEMDSIRNAFNVQQNTLKDSIGQLQNLLKANQIKYQQNLDNQTQSNQNYDAYKQTYIEYFKELRDLIDKEQEGLLNKLKEQNDASIIKFREKNNKYTSIIQKISEGLRDLKSTSRQSEIQFLSSAHFRDQIMQGIQSNVSEVQKVFAYTLSKNSIIDSILKSLEKNFKINNNPLLIPSPAGNKTPTNANRKTSKKSSIIQNPPANTKTYEIPTYPNSQIQKPLPKKTNIKKETIPVTSTNPSSGSVKLNGVPLGKSCTNVESQKRSLIFQKPQIPSKQKYDITKNCDMSIVEQKQSLFNSFLSNMTSFLTDQKYIYVLGGFDEESNNIIKLNLNNLQWESVNALKSPRSKFGCTVVDGSIFIMGGKKGRERASDGQIWTNGNCVTNFSLKKKRSGFGIVSLENYIYVIGGNDGESILNNVDILNTLTGEWSQAQPMSEARDQLAVCLGKDNKIYAIGGFGGKNNDSLKSVEVFDVKAEKWSKAPAMNTPRRALAAASLADGIYSIGGFDGQKHLSSVQKYEQGSNSWVKVSDLKRGRCTHSAVSIFDSQQIIVIGGFDEEALDSVERYSLISNEWEEITKMPSARFMHSSVLFTD